jgi:hypothetical protein
MNDSPVEIIFRTVAGAVQSVGLELYLIASALLVSADKTKCSECRSRAADNNDGISF